MCAWHALHCCVQIRRSGFTTPTPIQSIAWPVALEKHNLIGIASTGSGKTAAFLYPVLVSPGYARWVGLRA